MLCRATLLLALCAACPSPPAVLPSCRDAGCAGCCNGQERCLAGDTAVACGVGGATCAQCTATKACTARACTPVAPPTCADACSGCCDDAGTCKSGRATASCGIDGAACLACPAGKLCSAGGCITVTQCDLACGTHCCAGSSCDASPCGADAGACATCPAGERCSAGTCASAPGSGWRLRIVSAIIVPLRPNGLPWDDKNDPDPKACAQVSDAGTSCTLELGETFTPAWNTTFTPVFAAEQLAHVELSVIDVDYPGETVIDELGALDLRPRWSGAPQRWSIDGASVTQLIVEVVPQ